MQLELFDLSTFTSWSVRWADPWELCAVSGCPGFEEPLSAGLCYEHAKILAGASGVRIGELLKT